MNKTNKYIIGIISIYAVGLLGIGTIIIASNDKQQTPIVSHVLTPSEQEAADWARECISNYMIDCEQIKEDNGQECGWLTGACHNSCNRAARRACFMAVETKYGHNLTAVKMREIFPNSW